MSPEAQTLTPPPLAKLTGPYDLAGLRIPHHVGIIMDGNGRWAQQRGQPRFMGHRAGTTNIRRVLEASATFGIKVLTIYALAALSTSNWRNCMPTACKSAIAAAWSAFRTPCAARSSRRWR